MDTKTIRNIFNLALLSSLLWGGVACTTGEERARKKIQELGFEFSGQGFVRAITKKDRLAVKLFFEADIDSCSKNSNGIPVIMVAAFEGDGDTVAELLRRGANIHEKADVADYKGVSVLHTAAMGGDQRTIEILLEKGLNVNLLDDNGVNPLWYAAVVFYREEAVKSLLKRGATGTLPGSPKLSQSQIFDIYRLRALAAGKPGIAKLFLDQIKSTHDCASSSSIPENEFEAIQTCESTCKAGTAFACGVAGRKLVGPALFDGRQVAASDIDRAVGLFEKGCELKDFLVCSEIGRTLHSLNLERLQALKVECDSGKASACGRYAAAWDRPANSADKKEADRKLAAYSGRGCNAGDIFSCLWLASSFVTQANPDDPRDPMFQRAHVYYVKACKDGWSIGCDLMGK